MKDCPHPVRYFGDMKKKNILLLSQDLTLGGPALALFHMAEVMKRNGYDVTVGSMLDGPLRETISENAIPVIVDENMQIGTMKDCDWVKQFSLILCSTINFYFFLSDRFTEIPTIWWLHDSLFFYDGVDKQILHQLDRTNLKVISVGPVPQQAIQKFVPDLEISPLLYGVADECSGIRQKKKETEDKIRFITIGYIEARKGQDLLVKAIQNIPEDFREKAVFYFVGQNTSVMAQKLIEQAKDIPEIQITGPVDRIAINRMLERSDMMICPSREDPMPTVAAEAMMHGVPCLISDATGTAAYLRDGKDGFVFASENVEELTKKILYCIKNAGKLAKIGVEARKVYEYNFSMNTFEQMLMNIVDNIHEK